MKTLGRPPITNGKFSHVRRDDSSLYVAELNNGFIKVGFSDNPKTRLKRLEYECRKHFGCDLNKFHVFYGVGNRRIESRCIAALSGYAKQHHQFKEYFIGADFDESRFVIDREIFAAHIGHSP